MICEFKDMYEQLNNKCLQHELTFGIYHQHDEFLNKVKAQNIDHKNFICNVALVDYLHLDDEYFAIGKDDDESLNLSSSGSEGEGGEESDESSCSICAEGCECSEKEEGGFLGIFGRFFKHKFD
jgi:hypothetical protein